MPAPDRLQLRAKGASPARDTSSSGEFGSKEAEEDDDGVTESSGDASSGTSQGTGDDEDNVEAAQ
jgi:hypothetical protein